MSFPGNVLPLLVLAHGDNESPVDAHFRCGKQGKYEQAYIMYERVLEIDENVYAPDHPALATTLNNKAALLVEQVRPGVAP